jgi:radical SAM protein with 4Fe4S-binding SPASM domain
MAKLHVRRGSALASRKRWDTIYDKSNPFELPQNIARQVKHIARARNNGEDLDQLQYVWIYVTPVENGHLQHATAPEGGLATDEWLSILDESAALGTECVVISTSEGLDEHPEVLAMCSWAQETHGMLVGLHVYSQPLTPSEVKKLTTLDQGLFGMFVDSAVIDRMPVSENTGIRVYKADCDGRETMVGNCTIPEGMTCIGPNGKMYACGYVYGNKKYAMGHCFEKELSAVMTDDSIPRMIPRGDPGRERRCNGCPPLMQRMLEDAVKGGRVTKNGGNGKNGVSH